MKTVDRVDVQKFMGKWYVLAGRFTYLEKEPHNAVETYTWNTEKERIDIGFTFNKGSFEGPLKSIPQTAWIENKTTSAQWKVSPFWPLKFDYLVVALAADYSWTAIGVPSQKYLWIMARDPSSSESVLEAATQQLKSVGYSAEDLVFVPHDSARTPPNN